MHIVTTAPVSERHTAAIRELVPEANLEVFPSVVEAKTSFADAEILVTYGEDLTDEIIQQMPKLQWIQVISAGLELMPFAAIAERGVVVTNAKGIHAIPLAEHVMSVLLQFARRLPTFYRQQAEHVWDRSVRIDELHGKTLGILGVGALGSAIAERAQAFGMRVIGTNTDGRPVAHVDQVYKGSEQDRVLGEADYLTIIVPLTSQTQGMIGEKELRQMKSSAVLINVARGSVVDEIALISALENRLIAGAALDVFVEEPLPASHPFWGMEQVILTPHVSGRSPYYMERAMEIFRDNLGRWSAGNRTNLRNIIDPRKGY